jgi:hypothetical protein
MSVSLCLATLMTNLIRYVLTGINDRDRFAFGAGGRSQVHTPAALCLKLARPRGFGMSALPARYCGWPIGDALAVLAIHFASGLIRLRWNIIPEGQPRFRVD